MDQFDEGELSLPTAELIAGLSSSNQNNLVEIIASENLKLTTNQAKSLNELEKNNNEITKSDILTILTKVPQKKLTEISKVKNALVNKDITLDDDVIEDFLEILNDLKYLKNSVIE